MTADVVHGEISDEVQEKCDLDMSTYEDLPNACNVPIQKDDTDASYVFVASIDAQPQCPSTKLELPNGDSILHAASDSLEEYDAVQHKDNQVIAKPPSSYTDANRGEELGVESSRFPDYIQNHDDDGIVANIDNSDTQTNCRGDVEEQFSQKADEIQNHCENGAVSIKSSDAKANSGVEIEVGSFPKAHDTQILLENGIAIESSDTEANPREELEPPKVEDIEIQRQDDVAASVESLAATTKCGEELKVKTSQMVEDTQISEDNRMMVAITESSDALDNPGEEIGVESFERVDDIQESHDAQLEAVDCNCVNGIEKIDETENKSQVSGPTEIGGESQSTGISAANSEPDHPNDLVANTKEEYDSGHALNVENSERTQTSANEDGEKCWVVVEEQAGSSAEAHLLDPSIDNKVELEQNLAAAPCPGVILKFETEDTNGSISTHNEDGLPTSMDQDGPLTTSEDKSTSADRISCHESTETSTAGDRKVELKEVTTVEQEVNRELELEGSADTASCPKVEKHDEAEVLKSAFSENGDVTLIAPDESSSANADDSSAGSQLIPEGNGPLESIETRVHTVMIGNATIAISESFFHNDLILKPKNDASANDHVQPDQEVDESHDICLRNTDLETKFENGHIENDNQSTFPSDDVRSEPNICISTEECPVSEIPSGVNDSSVSRSDSYVGNNSELNGDKCSSILCSAANEKSVDDVEISSSMSSRDMADDDCNVSESEILKGSLVNAEEGLNTVSEVVSEIDGKSTNIETEAIRESHQDEPLKIPPEGSTDDASEGQIVGAEAETRPFYFLIKAPRFDDDNMREQIKHAQSEVERKTQDRDAIRVQIQTVRASWKPLSDNLEAAVAEERAARNSLKLKRQEIDSVQSQITIVKNVMSLEDIDGKLRNIEHTIEHETLLLKEEKQLIREIKQLKQQQEQLSLTVGKQDELQQVLSQKDQIEELLKLLRKKVDLLRDNVLKAESVTKAAKKKYNEENLKLEELQSRFKAADKIRQEAYACLQSMKKQLYEKSKYFWKYREDVKEAQNLASTGDRAKLQQFCVNQVETMMELWNKNDEFRKDYIRCNMRSTLRRLRTLDGRSLGPNEAPPALTIITKETTARDSALSMVSVSTQESEKLVPAESVKDHKQPVVIKTVETKSRTTKNKKPDKVTSVEKSRTMMSRENEVEETREEEIDRRTKEEEKLAAKAEELRKEEEAVKLKEQRKLEEKTKAKEALERKKRNAEKAQARLMIKAQKEAEEREKKKEKRAKKKEKKTAAAATAEAGDGVGRKESAEVTEAPAEAPAEAPKVSENTGKQVSSKKRYGKVLNKAKPIPPPLRNRGKRRMQPWMWVLLTAMVIGLLFVGYQRLLL